MSFQPLRVVAAGMLAAVTCLVAGCGSSAAPRLSAAAADRMNEALAATRAAADAHDKRKAVRALSALSGIVGRESRAGHLSAADEHALRTGIAQARRRIKLDVQAPQPEPLAPPAALQAAPVPQGPPAKERGKGHGKAKAKGKGKKKGSG